MGDKCVCPRCQHMGSLHANDINWVEGNGARRRHGHAALPSLDMPTERHFLKRHCWQRLRLMRTMEQFSFFRHRLYWIFCWILRRKKPWEAGATSEHLHLNRALPHRWRASPAGVLKPNPPHLAALTGMHAIVEARGHVPTHFTQQHHAIQLCGKRQAERKQRGGRGLRCTGFPG